MRNDEMRRKEKIGDNAWVVKNVVENFLWLANVRETVGEG